MVSPYLKDTIERLRLQLILEIHFTSREKRPKDEEKNHGLRLKPTKNLHCRPFIFQSMIAEH